MEYQNLIIAGLLGIFGFSAGYFRIVHLGQFSPFFSKMLAVSGLLLLTGLAVLFWFQILSLTLAKQISVGLYSIAGGLFAGGSLKNLLIQKQNGGVEYIYFSLATTVLPKALAVVVISFGIYRTDLLVQGPISAIGMSSGISLIAFGLYGWSLKIVPEFRQKGILLLDNYIVWEDVLSYTWHHETVLQIEYYNEDEVLCEFHTFVPPEDKAVATAVLNKHLTDKLSIEED